MTANLRVTIGVEVDMEDARRIAVVDYGADNSWTDEEILDVWATGEYNQGLGCEVEVLSIR